ncbi:hypothetical protein O181_038230 [Austropuccinia psidii MF-1]|uniref:Uncharacterized protein n=1 Tax=Austropuccinia psidii MF-1 TaxID=1389203 RepID=A0A9Q3DCI1_9BASI|nr:hypothetical protein [Austropuccinia psidii MF-1]
MQQMNQIMANLKAASSSEASRPQAFGTTSMKAPDCFDGTSSLKVRIYIRCCQLIFHNDKANFPEDRKNTQTTSSITGPYSNPNSLLKFGDPNEVRKAEAYMDGLIMKEGGIRLIISERDLPSDFWTNQPPILKDLMDITLEFDTRYHEMQKENNHHQGKKTEASKSRYSHDQNS